MGIRLLVCAVSAIFFKMSILLDRTMKTLCRWPCRHFPLRASLRTAKQLAAHEFDVLSSRIVLITTKGIPVAFAPRLSTSRCFGGSFGGVKTAVVSRLNSSFLVILLLFAPHCYTAYCPSLSVDYSRGRRRIVPNKEEIELHGSVVVPMLRAFNWP